MAKDKKPDKNNGSKKGTVTSERSYVLDRCFRIANQETRRSLPSSPSTIRVSDFPSRHQRRGAVRDKRTVSLDRPRPAHQRADNAYVETPFVDGVVPLQLQRAPPTASCSSTPYGASHSCGGSTSAGGRDIELQAITLEDMRSPTEPPPRPGEGIIDEFPAYVPWKAEQRAQEDSSACSVCHKCRCATCQKLCKYPGMRVCGVLDVQSRFDEACVETTTVCVPCVQKTARCPAFNAARAEAIAARAEAAATAAAATGTDTDTATTTDNDTATDTATATDNGGATDTATATDNGGATDTATATDNGGATDDATDAAADAKQEDGGGEKRTDKCRLRWLLCCLCFPCPYCSVDGVAECSTGCRGNVNVSGCECVDWEALRQSNRRRVNAAAAAVAASRDRRRCRDYHYYIKTMPDVAINPAASTAVAAGKSAIAAKAAADGENVGTATPEKKNRLRNFLRF